jgi:hypothetical protein
LACILTYIKAMINSFTCTQTCSPPADDPTRIGIDVLRGPDARQKMGLLGATLREGRRDSRTRPPKPSGLSDVIYAVKE